MNANSDTVVIQWSSDGGLMQKASTVADLTVFADGRVEVGPRLANGKVVEEQISEVDLKALCQFAFEEQDIWSIDSTALEQQVKTAARLGADSKSDADTVIALETEAIADAATTVIRVRQGKHEHEVSHYNLFSHAQRYPENNSLQRLRAIELRLLRFAQRIAAETR